MKQKPARILALLAIGWLGVELLFPPVQITQWSTDWGGFEHTRNARRGLEKSSGSDLWQVDYIVLAMESLLVLAALRYGASGLKKVSVEEYDGTDGAACRVYARCATVLHGAIILLPLCSAGSDTIWFVKLPGLLIIASPILVPNFVAFMIARNLSAVGTRSGFGLLGKSWVMPFLVVVSSLWSLLLIVAAVGPFDVKAPMSGAILGTLALWLTTLARALGPEETDDSRS